MRCDEVIELMQRHVDRDLNDEETERMKAHALTCTDCSDMLQRLERLNQDLENMPKVTPAYSLVDAILPKLQEIDATGSAGLTQAAAVESEASSGRVTPLRRRTYAPRATAWKAGGVVAAGLLLGLMIFNGLPQTFKQQASESATNTASTAQEFSADVAVADSSESAASEEGAESSQESMSIMSEQETGRETGAAAADQAETPAADGPVEFVVEEPAATESPAESSGSGDAGVISKGASGEEIAVDPATPQSDSGGELEPVPAEAGTGAEAGAKAETVSEPEQGEIIGIAAVPPADPALSDGARGKMGFASATPGVSKQAAASSEDGSLLAFIETNADGTVFVKVTNHDGGIVVMTGQTWKAGTEIRVEGWSGRVLHYAVMTADGPRTFTLDADSGTEAEAVPNQVE